MSRDVRKLRIGALGAGWIGLSRLSALRESGRAEIAIVCDCDEQARIKALEHGVTQRVCSDMDELFSAGLDGVIISTPSALHAEQTLRALSHDIPVFCQKPLARSALEARAVIETARERNLLLEVDLPYRTLAAMEALDREWRSGRLGRVFLGRFVFHNAYGPDKSWYYSPALSGGGCLIDLGTHLVDLALRFFGNSTLAAMESARFNRGRRLFGAGAEDFAVVTLEFTSGARAEIVCSWNASIGKDAAFEVSLLGTEGSVSVSNVAGSFYDFRADLFSKNRAASLVEPPDAWGGRQIVRWAERVALGERFDPAVERLLEVHRIIDSVAGPNDLRASSGELQINGGPQWEGTFEGVGAA